MEETKLGRNDPCWCGSKRKFKRCHLNREFDKELPFPALAAAMAASFKLKECLHPMASAQTCGKIVEAHTIQRAGVLARIADATGHCYTFYPPSQIRSPLIPNRCGWREASTFPGFCASHDGPTFAPVENQSFVGTEEQCFLLAYRAQCHELYQKQAANRSHEVVRDLTDRGRPPAVQRDIQRFRSASGAFLAEGLAQARLKKLRMDAELIAGSFSGYRRFFVTFDGEVSVVSTGCTTPNRSLGGVQLLDFADPQTETQALYFGVVPIKSGAGVVFSWREKDDVPARIVAELRQLPKDRLASTIVQFMFAYVENTFFSIAWWDSLVHRQRNTVARLALMGNPYDEDWKYARGPLVPWRIQAVADTWPLV